MPRQDFDETTTIRIKGEYNKDRLDFFKSPSIDVDDIDIMDRQ